MKRNSEINKKEYICNKHKYKVTKVIQMNSMSYKEI